ncbi:VOC family protein [Streptomyces durmitorensis]|uniref:Glyoxalase n=1 Tax=Streptomyces durmitorensis TaxID=319947 RepID=A0ABY4Q9L1_9ACTN|nr:hypothetical protein [Streptomyces durmitorensis]UQT61663.1 hypothetical protein M4V62_24875 [Streptomyces durmitorensis]
MLTGIDHVQLAAPPGSEPELRAFYCGVLGMTEIPKPGALASRGVPVTWDHALPGHRRFYADDPVGNRLEFLEALA